LAASSEWEGERDASTVGRVVVAATPIGCDLDASPRLREALTTAGVIAAEDTRRLWALARRLDLRPRGRVVSLHDANESTRANMLVNAALEGETVLVVSDAGTPVISDPGFRVVRLAAESGVPVTCIPGPSALLAALAVSGLPSDRHAFEGFWPRKAGEARSRLTELAGERRTMVFFVAARRLAEMLSQMARAWGAGRPAVVCRELTKIHEEIWRGGLGELAARAAAGEVLGEVTVVVGGAPPAPSDLGQLVTEVRALIEAGAKPTEAVAAVAARSGIARRDLYQAAIIPPPI
jgi:16S rRNA (cytidine1402-2'-O)-methyltransferase